MHHSEEKPRLDPVHFQLRASVGAHAEASLRSGIHNRGYLPHVKREGAVYFVTFRLADSLPRSVLMQFVAERAERLRAEQNSSKASVELIDREYARKVERFLDTGAGECVLERPDLAALVAEAIRFFDAERYYLRAWVVMPNHVHVVFWPAPNHTVSAVLRTWKQFTAVRANRILNRAGQPFWQRESYDHWIRNDEERQRCCNYVRNNPPRAGLCRTPEEWKWSSAWPGWRDQSGVAQATEPAVSPNSVRQPKQ